MKRFYWRIENILLAFVGMLHWIYTGCKSHPEMSYCGNALGCVWRWRMAKADWRAGLAPSQHVALYRRMKNTIWAEKRSRQSIARQAAYRTKCEGLTGQELMQALDCVLDDWKRGSEIPHGWQVSDFGLEADLSK